MTEVLHPTLTDRPSNDSEFVALSFMVGYANKTTRDGYGLAKTLTPIAFLARHRQKVILTGTGQSDEPGAASTAPARGPCLLRGSDMPKGTPGRLACSIDDCTNVMAARGWCTTHYNRWKRNGSPTAYATRPTLTERFWRNVVKGDGCWEWQRRLSRSGYGSISVDGRYQAAHRVSWMLAHGAIPTGLVVRHRCDNRACVRPSHLELGTPRDNVRDMHERGRANRPCGAEHAHAKLTEAQVIAIRDRAARGEPLLALSVEFGVTKETIRHAVKRITWRHVA